MEIQGKTCSFCGAQPATPEKYYNIRIGMWVSITACTNPDCPLWKQEMDVEDWNSLPDIASLLYQRDDARGERNAYMKSYEEVCKERDKLEELLKDNKLYQNMLRCLEILQPLDVVGEPNTLIALTEKVMREYNALEHKLKVASKAIKDMRWEMGSSNYLRAIQISFNAEDEIAKGEVKNV